MRRRSTSRLHPAGRCESTDVVGELTAEAARHTGLREGMPVVAGGADNACAAVAWAWCSPGTVLASIGTSGTVVAPPDTPASIRGPGCTSFCHAVPDTWYVMGVVLSAGGSLRWYRDTIGGDECRMRGSASRLDPYEVIMEEAAQAPPGSEGLFSPVLDGRAHAARRSGCPRRLLSGSRCATGESIIARSVLEGITFALADSAALVDAEPGHRSRRYPRHRWRRGAMPSWAGNACRCAERAGGFTAADEGPALGAAMLAGTGVGVYPSVREATDRMVSLRAETVPRSEVAPVYAAYHRLFDALYPVLRDRFAAVARARAGRPRSRAHRYGEIGAAARAVRRRDGNNRSDPLNREWLSGLPGDGTTLWAGEDDGWRRARWP